MVARRVVCLFNTTTSVNSEPSPHTTNSLNKALNSKNIPTGEYVPYRTGPSNLKYVGYSGLFGSSSPVLPSVPSLSERVLNSYEHLERWEDIATPIIRAFLRRLVFEGNFSFADRCNEYDSALFYHLDIELLCM